MKTVSVLVVDDSPTMRAILSRKLSEDPRIVVVGVAADPIEARQQIKALQPDVITLDVEMPGMNGIDFLEKIMRLRPTPVVMVSTLTGPGTGMTIEALEIGAFDCIAKPNAEDPRSLDRLANIVCEAAAASSRVAARSDAGRIAGAKQEVKSSSEANWPELIAIGASTGGVEALIQVVSSFPANCPPTLIVQHLPASFSASFAARLDRSSKATVREATHGTVVEAGHIYLASGGRHLTVRGARDRLTCRIVDSDPVNGHRPSVDVLFHSIAAADCGRTTAAVLTGLGWDGADGLLALRNKGAKTLAQDEATSLVYGMPRVAFERGGAAKQVPLQRIAHEIFA